MSISSLLQSQKQAEGYYELHKATPIFVADPPSAQSDPNGPSSASEDLSSLTPSESSDTTRVYDLTNRQTSLLQHDIIRCSRLPAMEPTAGMQTPPASPIDATLEHRQSTKHYLSERSASFQQLAEFKRAIEKNNQPLSVTVKPLNGVQQYFGKPAIKTTAAVGTSVAVAKTASMEIVEEISAVSAASPVAETSAEPDVVEIVMPTATVVESVMPTVESSPQEELIVAPVEQIIVDAVLVEKDVSDVSEIEVDAEEDIEVRHVTEAMEVDDRRVCELISHLLNQTYSMISVSQLVVLQRVRVHQQRRHRGGRVARTAICKGTGAKLHQFEYHRRRHAHQSAQGNDISK